MASFIIGIDLNRRSEDEKTRDYVAKKFRDAGHDVETVPVGPGYMQRKGSTASASGKIAIMMCNGSDLQTYKDFYEGITRGYYKYKYCYFGFQGWISPSTCSCKGVKTFKLGKAHDDYSSVSYTRELIGMTAAQVMEKYKSAIGYACGSSKEELADNLLKVCTGKSADSDEKESSSSSIKDALKEVLSFWDGEVECRVRGNKVFVNQIQVPSEVSELAIIEGVNVIKDSLNVHDYHPNTVNLLTVHWEGGKDIILRDEYLINRFGEVPGEITAVKYTVAKSDDNKTTGTNSDSTETEDTEDSSSSTYEEVPITNYDEAYRFGIREKNKIRRSNGHSVECQVIASPRWKVGEWVKVNIPSFELNDVYMYINKVNQSISNGGEWTCNLTLSDYPPSLGEFENKKEEDEESSEEESTEEVES